MAKLTLSVPVVGEKRTTAEPKVDTALKAVEEWANGNIGASNIEAKGVTEAMLSTALQTLINEKTAGGVLKKSIIATEESRESATYGTLTTPDEVELEMPTNGLFAVFYHATVSQQAGGSGKVAIFMDAIQLKGNAATPQVLEAGVAQNETAVVYTEATTGLTSASAGYTGDVTTGQIVPQPAWIFAAAKGKYKITVRYKATANKITAKNRKLWAIAFA